MRISNRVRIRRFASERCSMLMIQLGMETILLRPNVTPHPAENHAVTVLKPGQRHMADAGFRRAETFKVRPKGLELGVPVVAQSPKTETSKLTC